jgi:hypothetical protein
MKVTSEGFIDDIDKRAEENDKRIADAISDDVNIRAYFRRRKIER